ncbi:hypothetical protein BJ546DRAFT_356650 [Cryomyces antarcticus]|nr:Mitochondrial distribution and morphology protein 12 [Cryomyces antarcticus]
MSVDIHWDALTGGPDGDALAEVIRAFLHDKFQEVTLPRFIRSVQIHSFDFGSVGPEIELKDICDPLPDFYEDEDGDEDAADAEDDAAARVGGSNERTLREQRRKNREERPSSDDARAPRPKFPSLIDRRIPGLRTGLGHADPIGSPILSRAATPGIPGGTSNLSYFHLPLGAGLSGTATPLAAVAGAQFKMSLPDHGLHHQQRTAYSPPRDRQNSASSLSSPPDATSSSNRSSRHRPEASQDPRSHHAQVERSRSRGVRRMPSSSPPRQVREKSVEDVQIVSRIKYAGDIKMSLTAEILLDYPMPSFVGIPLKLNITGLTFDGIAILAYIKKRAHFCFLSPEDADVLVGADVDLDMGTGDHSVAHDQNTRRPRVGSLLEEIRVESEIGQKESGKQVLKNVGKVEKFVLEQVRRIFEDEFVYPSFWTFLV